MPPGWLPVPDGSPFPSTNLPYGVAAPPGEPLRVVVPLGAHALDLAALGRAGLLDGTAPDPVATFAADRLDAFLAAGPDSWHAVRSRLQELIDDPAAHDRIAGAVLPLPALQPVLPFTVADYVDFYSSREHATNVGRIFRPAAEPLPPNWRWQPLGYHGRAGTVVVSGTPVTRPVGQFRLPGADVPVVGPTQKLDVEAEVAFVVGVPTQLGDSVPTSGFADHVFGVVLLNDWSARDIQSWEYQPLGPFLGKSFATTISPWVVPLDALESARTLAPVQEPQPPTHLRCDGDWAFDLAMELAINDTVVARPSYASMYWTMPQQLAHVTSNGAALRTGDLFGSGTVSGSSRDEWGSLLEISWDGRDSITLADGSRRTYLDDGDRVVMRATAPGADGARIGFGDCAGAVLPARG